MASGFLHSPLPVNSSLPVPTATTISSPLSSDIQTTTSSEWSSSQSSSADTYTSSSELTATHVSGSVPSLLQWNAQAETRTLIDVLENQHRGQVEWQNLHGPDRPLLVPQPITHEAETEVGRDVDTYSNYRPSRHRHRRHRSHSCRRAKSHEVYQEQEFTKDLFLIIILCFVLACFLICLGRPIAFTRVFQEMAEP
ncbi:hypothetical protein K435DRAFT_959396 [Dendrothele bispora CBS 962.96]|uniref:Uncharacterized protein n=1 Tax=Dendrothele bispora (strain CBS 962.96) TaxID=1314807 RepID=A0A4S8MYV8_DENBC|nr:hypothetical protein K435DRAFT_959396 [Dendrothele bispora CBS 962.96]